MTERGTRNAVRRQHPHRQHGGFFFSRGRRAQVRRRRARRRHAAHSASARSLRHLDARDPVPRAQRGEDDAPLRRAAARAASRSRSCPTRGHRSCPTPAPRLVRAAIDAGVAVVPIPGRVGRCSRRSSRPVSTRIGSLFRISSTVRAATGARRSTRLSTRRAHGGAVRIAQPPRRHSRRARAPRNRRIRPAVVAREMTKQFEESDEERSASSARIIKERPAARRGRARHRRRGRVRWPVKRTCAARVRALRAAGMSVRDASAQVAAELGVSKRVAYRLARSDGGETGE